MRTKDFYYNLPEELIAQHPPERRDESRLLVLDRSGKLYDRKFPDLLEYLQPGDAMVINRTRVLPARLFGINEVTGARVEFLLLKRTAGDVWEALSKPARRARTGERFVFGEGLYGVVKGSSEGGGRFVEFEDSGVFEERLEALGEMPLPPYIHPASAGSAAHGNGNTHISSPEYNDSLKREQLESAKERYQTVYAKEPGSAAAPTAGLHFTPETLEAIRAKGVDIIEVLLHIGLGTFRPVSAENVEEHEMHSEYYEISADAKEHILAAKARGGRVFAVGTTSCRTLESAARSDWQALSGWTDIFITPGYEFKAVDALITNFHLPESTLIMLVSAFAGRERVLEAYAHAIEERYRFFSYGDCCLIV